MKTTPGDEADAWRYAAAQLEFDVTAPCEIALSNGQTVHAAALVKVGPSLGIVADPSWAQLESHTEALSMDGYGYSAVSLGEYDRSRMIELLRDWGWDG